MMDSIYQKIIEERNRSKLKDPIGFETEALSQLMLLAFENDKEPDTLPKHFRIENVFMTLNSIRLMFGRMGIKANIIPLSSSNGASFDVTLI